MKICVLGAGVVGVSTAFALARMGHEVEVIDRATDVASGASHANGAQLSWSHTDPLASPSTLKKIPKFILGVDPAMRVYPSLRMTFFSWGLAFLKKCSARAFVTGQKARDDLARESREALRSFERDLPGGALTPTGFGKIVLAQTQAQLDTMCASELFCSADKCLEHEPALKSWKGEVLGGLYAPKDTALDTIRFCQQLRDVAEQDFGVSFRFSTNIEKVIVRNERAQGVKTSEGSIACDAIIVCLGNDVNRLIGPLGLAIPLYSVRGYSITLPAKAGAPTVSVTDLSKKIVFANLGDRIRIAGFADINLPKSSIPKRIQNLIKIAREGWPDIADYDAEPSAWSGSRPMTPSGIPVIGKTKIDGLYLNAGHGSLGYTFAAGSAVRIANEIGGLQ
jgi:D-amino-acid dehydrogenase